MALTKVTYGLLSADTSAIDLNIDANTLYVDSSANNVGIGTTSPDRQLEVEGEGVIRLNADGTSGQVDPGIDFNTAGTNDMQFRYRAGSDKLAVYSYGTSSDVLTIKKSNGFVGIGTTNPLDLLHIKSSSTDARQVIDAHTDFDAELKFAENGTVKFTVGHDAATDSFVIGTSNVDTAKRIEINNSGAIKFNNAYTFPTSDGSANQFLQTDGSGTLSFATVSSSDSTKLPLAGGTLTGALTTNGVINTGTSHNFAINTPNSLRINIDSNNSGNEIFAVGHNQTGVDASNNVLFLVQALNGRAGIGATNLNATLQVGDGTTEGDATNPAIQIGRTGTYRFGMYASTEGAVIENKNGDDGIQFRVKTAGEAMRIDGGTGNVGIGETTPLGKLHVKTADSGASADGTADELVVEGSGDSGLSILSGGSNYGTILFSDSGDSAAGRLRYEHSNNQLNFGTNGAWNRMIIDSSGNLLVGGTTNRGRKVVVEGTGDLFQLYSTNSGAGGAQLDLTHDSSSAADGDKVGRVLFSTDDAQFASIEGIAISQSSKHGGIKFGVRASSSSYNYDAMTLTNNARLLVNTTVDSDNQTMRIAQSGSNADPVLSLDSDTGDQSYYRYMKFYRKGQTSSVAKLDIDWSGSSIGLAFTSDARLKTVTGEADGLELITRLNPVKYVWKSEPDREGAQGFLAQEVEQAYYETGNSHARGVSRPVDGEEHYMLDDTTLIPNLVKAIKELKDENDALKARVEALES